MAATSSSGRSTVQRRAEATELGATSSSTVWDVQRSAGAAEPGAVTVVKNDETVLRVAFYNVGIQQSDLDSKKCTVAEKRCRKFAGDIAAAFLTHRLDLLCICELGEHDIGLQGQKTPGVRIAAGPARVRPAHGP